jgi:hypothetical protein
MFLNPFNPKNLPRVSQSVGFQKHDQHSIDILYVDESMVLGTIKKANYGIIVMMYDYCCTRLETVGMTDPFFVCFIHFVRTNMMELISTNKKSLKEKFPFPFFIVIVIVMLRTNAIKRTNERTNERTPPRSTPFKVLLFDHLVLFLLSISISSEIKFPKKKKKKKKKISQPYPVT